MLKEFERGLGNRLKSLNMDEFNLQNDYDDNLQNPMDKYNHKMDK